LLQVEPSPIPWQGAEKRGLSALANPEDSYAGKEIQELEQEPSVMALHSSHFQSIGFKMQGFLAQSPETTR
jgi:hypothetical protein